MIVAGVTTLPRKVLLLRKTSKAGLPWTRLLRTKVKIARPLLKEMVLPKVFGIKVVAHRELELCAWDGSLNVKGTADKIAKLVAAPRSATIDFFMVDL
jgi:hypothetical protein